MFVDPWGLAIRKLTELANERGLTAKWNGKSGSEWSVTVDGYEFTLNQQQKNGDYSLKLNDVEESATMLSLHADDNKIYIDDRLFNCRINDGSGVTDESWMIDAILVGGTSVAKLGFVAVAKIASFVASATPTIAEQIPKAERIGSALKADVFHRAASFANLQGGQAYTWINGDKTISTLYQVAGELNGKAGIFEYLLNTANQITHQIF